jgi:hypothetical protein
MSSAMWSCFVSFGPGGGRVNGKAWRVVMFSGVVFSCVVVGFRNSGSGYWCALAWLVDSCTLQLQVARPAMRIVAILLATQALVRPLREDETRASVATRCRVVMDDSQKKLYLEGFSLPAKMDLLLSAAAA